MARQCNSTCERKLFVRKQFERVLPGFQYPCAWDPRSSISSQLHPYLLSSHEGIATLSHSHWFSSLELSPTSSLLFSLPFLFVPWMDAERPTSQAAAVTTCGAGLHQLRPWPIVKVSQPWRWCGPTPQLAAFWLAEQARQCGDGELAGRGSVAT